MAKQCVVGIDVSRSILRCAFQIWQIPSVFFIQLLFFCILSRGTWTKFSIFVWKICRLLYHRVWLDDFSDK